jgi:hypothetical protein
MSAADWARVNHRQLDDQHPWPGLDAYDEGARDYFHGRKQEADELLRRVLDSPLTVLFGRSGLGKTSLLRAGLFPRLRERHALPVYVRFSTEKGAPPLVDQVRDALGRTIADVSCARTGPLPASELRVRPSLRAGRWPGPGRWSRPSLVQPSSPGLWALWGRHQREAELFNSLRGSTGPQAFVGPRNH